MLPTYPFRQLNRCLPLAQLDDPVILLFSIFYLKKYQVNKETQQIMYLVELHL